MEYYFDTGGGLYTHVVDGRVVAPNLRVPPYGTPEVPFGIHLELAKHALRRTLPPSASNITPVCPHCGYDGTGNAIVRSDGIFRYLEDIVAWRNVLRTSGYASQCEQTSSTKVGVLLIDGLYRSGEGYDDGERPRLECPNCLDEFALPTALEVDFT